MGVDDFKIYKYLCVSSLLGLGSAVLADFFWFCLTGGIHLIDLTLIEPVVFLSCWYFGDFFSWWLCSYKTHLASSTYIFSYLIFILMSLFYGGFDDPSVKGWIFLCIIGYGIICLPAYFINKLFVIPNFF